MKIECLKGGFSPERREIWKEAFGDSDEFLDYFERTAFSPERSRALFVGGELASVLYWFDVELNGKMGAYVYAVATSSKFRGRGYCKALVEDTHSHFAKLGYSFALLVPASESLFDFYAKLGYAITCFVKDYEIDAVESQVSVEKISGEEYFLRRESLAPRDSVNLLEAAKAFLVGQTEFYAGDGLIFCGDRDGDHFFCREVLGDEEEIKSALSCIGCKSGRVRVSGGNKPFAMTLRFFDDIPNEFYHAFALD